MNELVGTSYFGSTTFRSISQLIGNMSNLWKDYDTNLTEDKYSLVQTILDLKERFDNYKSSTDPQVLQITNEVNDINTKIGQPWQDALSIYTYLKQLLDKDIELNQTITNTDTQIRKDMKTTTDALEAAYKKADETLDQRLDNAENAINAINNTTFPSVNASIEAISKRVTAHEEAWESSEENLVKDIENLSKTTADNYTELNQAIDDLETTASTNKQELQSSISELRTDLGTKFGEADAFTAIKANAAEIAVINSKIGTVSVDKPLSVQVNDNLSSINNLNANALTKTEASGIYVTNTALTQANYAKLSDLDNYITEEELIAKGYALDSVVSELSDKVEAVENTLITLGASEEFTETEVPAEKSILRAIFDQLADLNSKLTTVQEDIIIIKNKMNDLHPDNLPFPEDEEVIPPEEEEIPTE